MFRRTPILALAIAVVMVAVTATITTSAAETRPTQAAPLTANLDAALAGFNSTFLRSNGNQRYYKESVAKGEKDYFWRQALDIQGVQDVYDRTRRPETRDLIIRLLDTFLQQNQGTGGLYDWNWNKYNDDLLWAGLAFVRGYQITGNMTYLNQARYAFNRVYDRGWDSALGGGIWWDIKKTDKNALSNSPAVILGVLIYESSRDRGYLDKAQAVYDWTWLKLLDRSTGAVNEKMLADGSVPRGQTVYSAGAFISAAQALFRNTARGSIFADAKRTTDWVIRERTVNGILTNGQREGSWASEFARGMGEFVRENNMWNEYYDWMKKNADTSWNSRRTDFNVTWNRWDAQTPRDDTRAVEAVSALVMQAVTPPTKPDVSRIVSNWNNKCIDVPGFKFNDGQRLDVWDCNNRSNHRWEFLNGSLRTMNHKCMDVAWGSTDNGAAIQIATCNGDPAQQFVLKDNGDLVNPRSNKCVDIADLNPANGAVLHLWECVGGANQKWRRG